MTVADRTAAHDRLLEWLAASGVGHAPGARPGEHVVELPGEAKLATTVSILVGDQSLSLSAFVVRAPDENHEAFYRWLLTRNARLPGVAFALDRVGDVYLVGRLPIAAVADPDTGAALIDRVLGVVLAVCDESFNDLLVLGFLSSMRREWDWRRSRGESTRNLDAFRHLLEDRAPGGDEIGAH